jgi:hypothetical protein
MLPPWTADETSASGQVFEFRLWAALTGQSRGQLHVFLPLADRGVDALVHRLADGAYIAVQAKARSTVIGGEVRLVVWADSLADDSVLIVSGLVTDDGLGPTMLAVPAGEFKRLAEATTAAGRPVFSAAFGMNPRSDSRWLPWLVPSDRLVERFGVAPSVIASAMVEERPPFWRSDLGFLGESEVVRRLAEADALNLFRPFPDSETAELTVRHRSSGDVIGLQIKTVSVDAEHPGGTVSVYASSFRPAPTTYFTVLAWMREAGRFHEQCLFFESEALREFALETEGHIRFEFHPGSTTQRRLDGYRRALAGLRDAIGEVLIVRAR